MEVKHGTFNRWNRWNHLVNLSTGIVIQQEVTESCSKQEVSPIPKVGERELGDQNSKNQVISRNYKELC